MWDLKSLTPEQIQRCLNTVSSNTFYMLVGDALDSKKNLSVIRMADGEQTLMGMCMGGNQREPINPTSQLNEDWLKRYGVTDISKGLLKSRLQNAADECDYFAASLSGIQMDNYNVDWFSPRERYVDNFYPDAWSVDMKINLFKKAGHVLFIYNNTSTADAMQIRAKYVLNVKVTYLKLTNWKEADDVIEKAKKIDAPLTLFSSGPASKHIGPQISKTGNIPKVTLDLGHAANYWTLLSLKDKANEIRFAK